MVSVSSSAAKEDGKPGSTPDGINLDSAGCSDGMRSSGCSVVQAMKEARWKNYKKKLPPRTLAAVEARRRTDNWRNILYLGGDWLGIALAMLPAVVLGGPLHYAIHYPLLYLLSVFFIGSRMRGLMNLVHQASHGMLFRNRKANEWAGMLLASFPLLASLNAYVCAHCRHHAYLWRSTGNPKTEDPKPRRYAQLGLVKPVSDQIEFLKLHVLRPILLYHVPGNIWGTISWDGEPMSERRARVGFWVILLSTFVAADLLIGTTLVLWLVLFWVVPYVTSFQIIRYFGEGAEHAGLRSDSPWLGTRSWSSSWPVEFLLAPHTDHYHIVHHLFPLIPHYRMREAHTILMRQVPEYAAAHHCDGFIWPRRTDAPSVIQDMRHPEAIHTYSAWSAATGGVGEHGKGLAGDAAAPA